VPGKKDKMLSLSTSGPYQCKMYSASRMHVVLYDTEARCAWLVDGANALLHLTRAQVSREPYSDNPLIIKIFPHTNPSDGPGAALKSLATIAAINYIIYEDDPGFGQTSLAGSKWGLKDVVLQNWHLLEQIQDYQTDLCAPGMPMRLTDRDRLEGFGFLDLISGKSTISPRVATLEASGRGWVDFTRAIAAITLMARGFGELIRPSEDSNALCKSWTQVPRGMDYLVARVLHLWDICEEMGNVSSKSLELVQGLYWHQGGRLYGPCAHKKSSLPCDRVQVLIPKLSLGTKRRPDPFVGSMNGGVIFGRSNRISKWWPKNPKVAPMDNKDECFAEDSRQTPSNTSPLEPLQDSSLASIATRSEEAGTSASSNPYQVPSSNSSVASLFDKTQIKTGAGSKVAISTTLDIKDQTESFEVRSRTAGPRVSHKGKEPVHNFETLSSRVNTGSPSDPRMKAKNQSSDNGTHAVSMKTGPASATREVDSVSTAQTETLDNRPRKERGIEMHTKTSRVGSGSQRRRHLRRVNDHLKTPKSSLD
jgi:hypothetical protein